MHFWHDHDGALNGLSGTIFHRNYHCDYGQKRCQQPIDVHQEHRLFLEIYNTEMIADIKYERS